MSGFKPNDKVVCIDDRQESVFGRPAGDFYFPRGRLVKGAVYCVEAVFPAERGTQGLYLTGPTVHLRARGLETGFNSMRFRKVHPKAAGVTTEEQEIKERTDHEPAIQRN